MLFRSKFCAGVEPMSIVGGPPGDGPLLHGHGHDACLLVIQFFSSFGGGEKFGVHILGKSLSHGFTVENILIKNF